MNTIQQNNHRSNCVLYNSLIPFVAKAATLDWIKHALLCKESCDCVKATGYSHTHTYTFVISVLSVKELALKTFFL